MSPQYHQSSDELDYAVYNRYSNIRARGPCIQKFSFYNKFF
jgi:hypothetical protein